MDHKTLEKIVKGFSNHRRIQILAHLDKNPNKTLFQISEDLGVNFKTIGEHTKRLAAAGLIEKKYKGSAVLHNPTKLGELVLKFLRTLE